MQDTDPLRALISEYDRLRSLDGGTVTRQVRGIRFNEFIADLLRLWGIDARASTATPAGELDVSFAFGGQRYIAEAKWTQSKTDAEPLAKLGLRLRQRMRGTIGVFISMAGYTPQALAALPDAGDRSILLFDRSHIEAMVSGLVPPDELLDLAYDHAAYKGEAYVPLLDLLAPTVSAPTVTFEVPPNGANERLSVGLSARVACTVSGTGPLGMASLGPGKILIAGEDGMAEVDHIKRTAAWRVPVRGSHGNPVLRPDGSIAFARRHGIGVVADGHLAVVAGGFPDRCSLFTRSDGSVWVLDPINEVLNQVTPTVVRLGERLGEEERHKISPSPPWPVGAAWLDETRLVLGHQSSCSLIELDEGIPEQVRIATGDCVGLVPLGGETLLTVSGHADIDVADLVTGRSARVGALPHRPAVRGVAQGDETTTYVAVGTQHDVTAIIAVEFEMPAVEVVARSFAASDSGDLAGYRAEVVGLAGRHVTPSGRSDAELQQVYNDMLRLVYDQLGKPVGDRVQTLGLELSQDHMRRSVEGGWPPGYGGSASCPRWRRPGQEGAWLEASIGLGYRTWPSQRSDDIVLALMLAIMNDRQQHTLLTRFVLVAAGDPELGSAIQRILGDVDQVLPTAVALLADQ
ncbi:restriction endonuclease [Dactylosporangium sp. NPDC051485]|uniref:restriction endonuclease n=1 Tax=Dactylosporangium sp. NPDC051485 TaxID=3154846 RepID=UPI0034356421